MLVGFSLSREPAVIGTEIWEENTNVVLRRQHCFILALDAWGTVLPNMHTWLKIVHLIVGQGYPHSSQNC